MKIPLSCFKGTYLVIGIVLTVICYSCATVTSSPRGEFCGKGYKAYLNRDWSNAIYFYSQALEADSSDSGNDLASPLCIYQRRPLAYARIGKFQEAIADANFLVNMRPNHVFSYVVRSEVFSRSGNHKEALEDCETIQKMEPEFWRNPKAIALIRAGRVNEGLKLFDETKSSQFDLFDKAEALDEAGMSKDALLAYKVALLSNGEGLTEAQKSEIAKRTITHGLLGYLTSPIPKRAKFTDGMIEFAKQRIVELESLK